MRRGGGIFRINLIVNVSLVEKKVRVQYGSRTLVCAMYMVIIAKNVIVEVL